jgi:hypothetical protein
MRHESYDITCQHIYDRIHEETLVIGGSYPIGYECRLCHKWVDVNQVPPTGLDGVFSGDNILYAPHGGRSTTSSGKPYTKQILKSDGTLEIIDREVKGNDNTTMDAR